MFVAKRFELLGEVEVIGLSEDGTLPVDDARMVRGVHSPDARHSCRSTRREIGVTDSPRHGGRGWRRRVHVV